MKRNIWSELVQWKSKKERKPLIIKGARQIGKTYILKQFGEKCFDNFHYINFEKDKTISNVFAK